LLGIKVKWGVLVRRFWDYKSGNNFQQGQTVVQPGSLMSKSGIVIATIIIPVIIIMIMIMI
jgi:hypothetical protein